jgi:thiol:disulfide interchange protein
VQQPLAATVLRADVTASSADQAPLKRFGIFGPPTIVSTVDGQERRNTAWSAT